ncbi:MAG: phosphoadenylyl-sulfate reductase [Actinomycetota bacterium]|nr:phosphoadenylyl-sulfate reductase [Actinomycetota bacterium]
MGWTARKELVPLAMPENDNQRAARVPDGHGQPLDREGDPREILEWAAYSVDRLVVATSFQSSGLVILHMLREIKPDLPVLFLDTGFHFPETMQFARGVAEDWGLKLVVLKGKHRSPERQAELYGPELYRSDPNLCCQINKLEPLQAALEEFDGWISGLRRDQSPERETSVKISHVQILPSGRAVLKIHPLANWTKADVEDYLARNRIATHPLLERGYRSIGCWPCTRAVGNAEGERDGRWPGLDKSECGIHTFGQDNPRQTEAEQ